MLVTEMRIKFCYIFMNETINCGQNSVYGDDQGLSFTKHNE